MNFGTLAAPTIGLPAGTYVGEVSCHIVVTAERRDHSLHDRWQSADGFISPV
jgi:hypothetical protein